MRKQFLEVNNKKEAEELAPYACEIVKVEGGYLAFESWDDYLAWRDQK